MTKNEFVATIANQRQMSRKDVADCVAAIFDQLREGLQADGRIELRNFGVFTLRTRSARQGRNPRTGELLTIPEHKTVHFKPASTLKTEIAAQR